MIIMVLCKCLFNGMQLSSFLTAYYIRSAIVFRLLLRGLRMQEGKRGGKQSIN